MLLCVVVRASPKSYRYFTGKIIGVSEETRKRDYLGTNTTGENLLPPRVVCFDLALKTLATSSLLSLFPLNLKNTLTPRVASQISGAVCCKNKVLCMTKMKKMCLTRMNKMCTERIYGGAQWCSAPPVFWRNSRGSAKIELYFILLKVPFVRL